MLIGWARCIKMVSRFKRTWKRNLRNVSLLSLSKTRIRGLFRINLIVFSKFLQNCSSRDAKRAIWKKIENTSEISPQTPSYTCDDKYLKGKNTRYKNPQLVAKYSFAASFGSMLRVFHLAWSTCHAPKSCVADWRNFPISEKSCLLFVITFIAARILTLNLQL